ncbi:MAG: type II secretion system minor pseudopilin GspK [Gammaproteobacteria bacterium]|nr:type II secretion system minor pseudopilin GspK [Gammaproteobacteria bacterium]
MATTVFRRRSARARRQAGVALITALLVVAVTTVAMVGMTSRLMVELRRTENLLHGEQAVVLLSGVEGWALGQLVADLEAGGPADHGGEDWARALPPTELENGYAEGRIEDLQGRFNINGLIGDDSQVNAVALERFKRLLAYLDLPASLTPALLDWLDRDQSIRFPGGAEDDYYSRLTPPYRPADRPMVAVSELRLVKGFEETVYQTLRPYVTTLPGATTINVNSAPVALLMTLADDLVEADLEALVEARREQPFLDVDSFLRHPALAGTTLAAEGLGVASDHFAVHGTVTVGRAEARLTGLLQRRAGASPVVLIRYRHYGNGSP